jgi:Outer membrane protein beta-barrel domain
MAVRPVYRTTQHMRRLLSLAALSVLAVSASASAQRSGTMNPSPEIGIDAGITFGLSDPNVTTIAIPAQQIRMGFFVSPALSIEPTFGLQSISGGGETFTAYQIGAGLLYHFSPSRAANQFYVRPFLNIVGTSGGGQSDSQALFGIGGGLKVPLRDRIASRFEANFAHTDGSDMIGLLAGLSFYTR